MTGFHLQDLLIRSSLFFFENGYTPQLFTPQLFPPKVIGSHTNPLPLPFFNIDWNPRFIFPPIIREEEEDKFYTLFTSENQGSILGIIFFFWRRKGGAW